MLKQKKLNCWQIIDKKTRDRVKTSKSGNDRFWGEVKGRRSYIMAGILPSALADAFTDCLIFNQYAVHSPAAFLGFTRIYQINNTNWQLVRTFFFKNNLNQCIFSGNITILNYFKLFSITSLPGIKFCAVVAYIYI